MSSFHSGAHLPRGAALDITKLCQPGPRASLWPGFLWAAPNEQHVRLGDGELGAEAVVVRAFAARRRSAHVGPGARGPLLASRQALWTGQHRLIAVESKGERDAVARVFPASKCDRWRDNPAMGDVRETALAMPLLSGEEFPRNVSSPSSSGGRRTTTLSRPGRWAFSRGRAPASSAKEGSAPRRARMPQDERSGIGTTWRSTLLVRLVAQRLRASFSPHVARRIATVPQGRALLSAGLRALMRGG